MKELSVQTRRVNFKLIQSLITIGLLITILIGHVAWGQQGVNAANSIDESDSERLDLRTRNAKVFQRQDGSGYAVVYMRPIHFQAQDGSWQEYDNRLLPDETGVFWRNQAGDFQITFGKELTSFRRNDILRMSNAPNESLIPIGITTHNVDIGFQPLNAASVGAQVKGTSVVYPEIYPGVDLRYTVDNDLLKEDLIFYRRPSQTQISFLVTSGSKLLTLQDDGRVSVECTEECLSIMPPYMQDAAGAISEDIQVELEYVQNGYYILTYTLDMTWLNSPKRKFPVVLDPTVIAGSGYSTYVQEGFPTVARCNANTFVAVGYDPGNVGQKRTRGFFHLSLPTLPAGSTITSATFRAYQYYYEYSDGYTANIYRVTSDWANPQTCGAGINVWTWNNPPGIDWSTIYDSSDIPRGKIWGEWTITGLVQQWYGGVPNQGLAVVASPETARGSYFCSSIAYAEGQCGVPDPQNYRPHAVIDYIASFSISGKVVDSGGFPIAGVTVSNGAGKAATTDNNGNYTLTDVAAGSYTLTPSKSDYAFSPASRSVNVPPDATGQDFTVTNRYAISGYVTDGLGNPIAGVPISCIGLYGIKTVNTNSSGYYMCGELKASLYLLRAPEGSPYTLSPSVRILFIPPSRTSQDFSTRPLYGSLNGQVIASNGQAIANARVSVAGKVGSTNANGNYSLTELLPGEHTMRVTAAAYLEAKVSVVIQANQPTQRNITLMPVRADGYRLPWQGGVSWYCTQGNGGSTSHSGTGQYAYDFSRHGVQSSTNVVATRAGKVVGVVNSYDKSCYNWTTRSCTKVCGQSTNYVKILHDDGTASVYLHLKKVNTPPVSVGDHVVSGQVIGYVGNTGCSQAEHLHFQRNKSEWNWQSVLTPFLDVATNNGVPVYGKWYTSGNYQTLLAIANMQSDTQAPFARAELILTGTPTYKVQLDAIDYESDTVEVRLAHSEVDLQAANWQPFTGSQTLDWDFYAVYAEFRDAAWNTVVHSDVVEAIAFEPIEPMFSINAPVCVGQALVLQNTTTPFCEQCGWNWDMGNGVTSQLAEPQYAFESNYPIFSYDAPGTYTMTLTVANIDSVKSTAQSITVLSSPLPDFDIRRSGAMITVEAVTKDAANWLWDFGDGKTASGTSIATHIYTDTTQIYGIQLIVEGKNGCSSIETKYLFPLKQIFLPLVIRGN